MVMEAPPSPQSVGREFVRQYYTLLNKAPTHLHRFYNHQSSFVHGGLDPPNRETSPVIGQKQIHQKIQQLNFRDCHAKITQVDSQATLGNGVVVQVTGELSNAGQPMRRFTQTFVLAAQSPKKYYVHNDIFRYQDEIISDEDCEPEVNSETEEEVSAGSSYSSGDEEIELRRPQIYRRRERRFFDLDDLDFFNRFRLTKPTVLSLLQKIAHSLQPPGDDDRQVMVEVQPPINQPAVQPYYNPNASQIQPIPAVPIHHNQQPPPHVMAAQPVVPTLNGAIHPDEINVMQGQVPAHIPAIQPQGLGTPMPTLQPSMIQAPLNPPAPIEEVQPEIIEEPIEEPLESAYVVEQQELEPEQDMSIDSGSSEPKTYANLLKSGGAVPFSSPPSQAPSAPVAVVQPAAARSVSPPSSGGYQNVGGRGNNNGNMNNRGGARVNQQQPRMQNRQDSGRGSMGGGGRNSFNEEAPYEERRRPQNQNFNDVNQLFLGNLPHTATEDDLREIFSEFGTIVDLRVHSKPPNKIGGAPGGRAPPNFGFITYDTQQGVQKCLQAKPIFYPKNDNNGTPLNVEEKKTKERVERPPYGGGRPMDNRGRGDNGGPRRGMGGPGGPNRNSSGGPGGPPGPNNRNNTYNSRNSGGPPSRGSNNYNRR